MIFTSKLQLNFIVLLAVLICWGCSGPSQQQSESATTNISDTSGWVHLFGGTSTEAWRSAKSDSFPERGWSVSEGQLMLNAAEGDKGGDLITRKQFSNFVLDWEWKMLTRGGNSGVKYFVKTDPDYDTYGPGLEYQILDDDYHEWMLEGKMKPGDFHTLAALYELYPATDRKIHALGEWNTSRIVADGHRVEHWLNGIKVLEFVRGSDDFRSKVAASKFAKYPKFGEAEEGHILLQDHGSKMAFRNIRIKPIQP